MAQRSGGPSPPNWGRPYITRRFPALCSNSETSASIFRLVKSSDLARANWQYFMIFISSSTRSFFDRTVKYSHYQFDWTRESRIGSKVYREKIFGLRATTTKKPPLDLGQRRLSTHYSRGTLLRGHPRLIEA